MGMRNKTYFISDVHLGSKAHNNPIEIERQLCCWLDFIKLDAKEVYLMGDIFDYWYEYKYVVPKGFVRVLGKLAEMTDSGIEVHFFVGNHDLWLTNYLEEECGITLHHQPKIVEVDGRKLFLAHGDGLGQQSCSSRFLRAIFRCRFLRFCFSTIHPRWTIPLGQAWSNYKRKKETVTPFAGEDKEELITFAKKKLKEVPDIDLFILGHRHLMLEFPITNSSQVIFLGDWITYFSYGVLDEKGFHLRLFETPTTC